jgi:quinol monooxygenase YgiN
MIKKPSGTVEEVETHMPAETFQQTVQSAMRSEGPVTLLVTVGLRDGALGDIRTALHDILDRSRREEGCLGYDVYHVEGDDQITFVERWASGAHLARHQEREFVTRFNETALPYASGLPEARILVPIG